MTEDDAGRRQLARFELSAEVVYDGDPDALADELAIALRDVLRQRDTDCLSTAVGWSPISPVAEADA